MNRIQSKNHKIEIYELNKISLSCFDDRRYILNNRYDELGFGYKVDYETKLNLITIQNSFFVKL